MQNQPATLSTESPNDREAGKKILPYLQRSSVYREYLRAFENSTGLPLTLRPAGAFQAPMHDSKRSSPFCRLMTDRNKSCAACLQFQQRLESSARTEPATLVCFAGLHESAVPVRSGKNLIGYLQTGQVFVQKPTATDLERVTKKLKELGVPFDARQLEQVYFQAPVIPKKQYDSIIHLLHVFSQHLADLSNQCVVSDAQAELPAITKARAFIAAQQSEDISLADVAHAANMSAFYFCKVFRRSTGLTFTDFLARTRVESVKKLLLNPHARMSEVAYTAGFQSLSQFNRVFHRVVGEPPSSYHGKLHPENHRPDGSSRFSHAA